ncbi:MAG: hypothetical protein AAF392_03145 [Bacteroidota bacterium]
MEVLLDVQDSKADLIIELLESPPSVRIKSPATHKVQVLRELEEAVENLKLVQAGKLQATPIEELLDEA